MMKAWNEKILVLVVTWNGSAVIRQCLDSLRRSTIPVVTYVVDNNSEDDTVEVILHNYPEVILKTNSHNLGFGQANNIGFNYAIENGFDYVMMLNQDTYIEPDAIQRLVEAHLQSPDFGVLSPMHYKKEGILDDNFYRYVVNGCDSLIHDLLVHSSRTRSVYPCGFVNAAAWLLSAKCIKGVGGFNPVFFHTGEDVDYYNRVNFLGFGTGIVYNAVIYHTRSNWGRLKGYANPYVHRYVHYQVALLDPRHKYTMHMVMCTLLKEAFCQSVFGRWNDCKETIRMAFKLWEKRKYLKVKNRNA